MMDGGYHGTTMDKDFARLRQMQERLEVEATAWPPSLNAAEYRTVEDMISKGAALKARLTGGRPEEANDISHRISTWYFQANLALSKPAKRQLNVTLTHLFGLMAFTSLWGIWVFNFHKPEFDLAIIATATQAELERLAGAGLRNVILSLFPRVFLFSLLGTLFYVAASLLRKGDRTAGLRHIVALACAAPTAILLSVFLAANLVTKAKEIMLAELARKTSGLSGILTRMMDASPKAPPAAQEAARAAAEAKHGLDAFTAALTQAESVFHTFIGTNEATVYFFTTVIAATLPMMLIFIYSRIFQIGSADRPSR